MTGPSGRDVAGRGPYPKAERRRALGLAARVGVAEAARRIGISARTITRWAKAASDDPPGQDPVGKGARGGAARARRLEEGGPPERSVPELLERIRRGWGALRLAPPPPRSATVIRLPRASRSLSATALDEVRLQILPDASPSGSAGAMDLSQLDDEELAAHTDRLRSALWPPQEAPTGSA